MLFVPWVVPLPPLIRMLRRTTLRSVPEVMLTDDAIPHDDDTETPASRVAFERDWS